MIAMIEAEYESKFEPTKHTPYLALMDELRVSLVRILEKIDRVIMAPPCKFSMAHPV